MSRKKTARDPQMAKIFWIFFLILGTVLIINSNNHKYSTSKTWYYNEKNNAWEEAEYISSGGQRDLKNSAIIVPGMKEKE